MELLFPAKQSSLAIVSDSRVLPWASMVWTQRKTPKQNKQKAEPNIAVVQVQRLPAVGQS